jgi:hypothetical protein
VIDAIEAVPEDRISISEDFIILYGKYSNTMKVFRKGVVRLNGDLLVTLDVSYTERLFDKIVNNSLKKHKEKMRKTFEEFKNG